MPWIELTRPTNINGRVRPAGTRLEFPPQAGLALYQSGAAFWVDGPHKRSEAPKEIAPEDPAQEDPEEIAPEATPEAPEREDTEWPDLDAFNVMEIDDKKDVIRRAGLAEECDMRKPVQMSIVYGAWLVENYG